MSIKLEWEEIDDYHKRAKIQGGWLVKTYEDRFVSFHEEQRPEPGYEWQVSMCFVPDINHEWGNPVSGSDATIHIAENDMHLTHCVHLETYYNENTGYSQCENCGETIK